MGEGPRQPYLLREIILNDVCEEVLPQSAANGILNAMLPYCSGMVHFADEGEGASAGAQGLGIPVLSLRRTEGAETLLAWLQALSPVEAPRQPVWADEGLWTMMIEGE